MKNNPALVAYLRQLATGPLLARTIHDAVISGSSSVGGNASVLWHVLCREIGTEKALEAVEKWIAKPYRLPR